MPDANLLIIILATLTTPALIVLYFSCFQLAIMGAVKEHRGEKFFNRLYFVVAVLISLAAIYFLNQGFPSAFPLPLLMGIGVFYLTVEIPYQIVKYAAKAIVHEIESVADDKREVARLKSAQTLGAIISEKLTVGCELQAFSQNEEFLFLTYIVNNKPIATRLKLNQADKPENWKKLGEWIITNYQKENPQS